MAIHDDRTRMDVDLTLTEPDPYSESEWQYRHKDSVEEWAYDQGFDCVDEPFWRIVPSEIEREIGRLFLQEGQDDAREAMYEEIQTCIDVMVAERLSNYVDGQMRLYAGYDVAENGDTLEEGSHSDWEHLRMMFEAGVRDALCDDKRYASI